MTDGRDNEEMAPEEMGKIGESHFHTLMLQAGLVPNRSLDWDMMGWDTIVQWKPSTSLVRMDRQEQPIGALVQIKTVREDGSDIRTSLSAINRFAKVTTPCFVCVITLESGRTPTGVRMIHVAGDFLGRVIKGLCQATVEQAPLNTKGFSFSSEKWGEKVDMSGPAIRGWMEQAVGASMAAYIATKTEELDTLGYADGRFKMSVLFNVKTREELADGLLGLSPLSGSVTRFEEERFGMLFPAEGLKVGQVLTGFEMEIDDEAEFTVHNTENQRAIVLKGGCRRLPVEWLDVIQQKVVLKFPLITLILTVDRKFNLTITVRFDVDRVTEGTATVQDWTNLYRFAMAMASGKLEYTMTVGSLGMPVRGRILFDKPKGENRADAAWLKLMTAAELALSLAGKQKSELKKADVRRASSDLKIFREIYLASPSVNPLVWPMEVEPGVVDGQVVDLLYFKTIDIGELTLVYCTRVDFRIAVKQDQMVLTSEKIVYLNIVAVESDGALDRFIESMRELTGTPSYYLANKSHSEEASSVETPDTVSGEAVLPDRATIEQPRLS